MSKRAIYKLTARQAGALSANGRHSDGGGLYLSISPQGWRRWVFLFALRGKQREMGLGPSTGANAVTLAQARAKAEAARGHLRDGLDPIEAAHAAERTKARGGIGVPTFGDLADQYVKEMRPSWRNEKHAAQWSMTLTKYSALIRKRPVDTIDTDAILSVLRPIWTKRPETAQRLRGRVEKVLDAAKAKGYRSAENPARWRGHLDQLLPGRRKLARGHHAALPYKRLSEFMSALQASDGVAARLLEFTILTAARTGEAVGACWCELDLDEGVWTIPADRMKAQREHRVPLSRRAINILREMEKMRAGAFAFPARRGGRLSDMAMAQVLKRLGYVGVTVHGFRSAFRDWAAETTGFPHEVCEMALAHTIANKAEAAYRRGDLFDKRRELMAAWAAYCEPKPANVVELRHRNVSR